MKALQKLSESRLIFIERSPKAELLSLNEGSPKAGSVSLKTLQKSFKRGYIPKTVSFETKCWESFFSEKTLTFQGTSFPRSPNFCHPGGTDDCHSQNKLEYPKHFCHPGMTLFPPITNVLLGSLHIAPHDHCVNRHEKAKVSKVDILAQFFGLFKLIRISYHVRIIAEIYPAR